jgi:hypothetical protein
MSKSDSEKWTRFHLIHQSSKGIAGSSFFVSSLFSGC